MYIPNNKCQIQYRIKTDGYGQSIKSSSKTEPCCVVRLLTKGARTSPRQTLSATETSATDQMKDLVLLVGPNTIAKVGSIVSVGASRFLITGLHPQYDLLGRLDHYELTGGNVPGG